MTFEEVLTQAIAMLQRQGRVAYRALARQFDLAEDYLEDLKEAILYAHPQVVDDGRGLVWTGAATTPPAPVPPPATLALPPALQEVSPPQPTTPRIEAHLPEAERRQLTVMFCDLVDSTPLAARLDPVYRVLRESSAQSRLDVAAMRGLTPLVGRESEVTFLRERWECVTEGQGHVVLLSGEAGIGKSRLVRVLREHIASAPHVRWECRSSPYDQHTALYPISDFLQRTLSWQSEEAPDEKLAKLEQALRSYRLPLEETVPLFVEEMTKATLESGHLTESDGCYELAGPLPSLTIPTTLQDSLMARLDRLVTAKAVAQYAAVIGRQFSYELLQAVTQLDAATLQRELGRLVEAELIYQRGVPPQAMYVFKHALIRDIAYESLLRSTRQGYHQRVATVLEAQFPETAATQPELLAHHCTEAGLSVQAVRYWHQAGQHAIQRSAHEEAVAHLTQGLAILTTLPHTPERARQELALQTSLGQALMPVRGYATAEVEHVYLRARTLSQEVDDTAEHVRALMGLYAVFFVRADHEAVDELTGELLHVAEAVQDPLVLIQTYATVGESLFYRGQLALARTRLEHAMSLYRPQQYAPSAYFFGHHPVVQTLAELGDLLWFLGYPERAVQHCDQALTFAQGLSHPFSLAFALSLQVLLHQRRREPDIVQEHAETLITVSTENGFPFRAAIGNMLLGWTMVERGAGQAGIARIEDGIAAFQKTGARLRSVSWLALRAEAYGKRGQGDEGLIVVADALRAAKNTGEHFYDAELQRLKGEFLLQQSSDNQREAETCFNHAMHVARAQQARSWELRAAMSLARLWQRQGKRDEARQVLAEVYDWCTEGFDTADLQEAKLLLEEL